MDGLWTPLPHLVPTTPLQSCSPLFLHRTSAMSVLWCSLNFLDSCLVCACVCMLTCVCTSGGHRSTSLIHLPPNFILIQGLSLNGKLAVLDRLAAQAGPYPPTSFMLPFPQAQFLRTDTCPWAGLLCGYHRSELRLPCLASSTPPPC